MKSRTGKCRWETWHFCVDRFDATKNSTAFKDSDPGDKSIFLLLYPPPANALTRTPTTRYPQPILLIQPVAANSVTIKAFEQIILNLRYWGGQIDRTLNKIGIYAASEASPLPVVLKKKRIKCLRKRNIELKGICFFFFCCFPSAKRFLFAFDSVEPDCFCNVRIFVDAGTSRRVYKS